MDRQAVAPDGEEQRRGAKRVRVSSRARSGRSTTTTCVAVPPPPVRRTGSSPSPARCAPPRRRPPGAPPARSDRPSDRDGLGGRATCAHPAAPSSAAPASSSARRVTAKAAALRGTAAAGRPRASFGRPRCAVQGKRALPLADGVLQHTLGEIDVAQMFADGGVLASEYLTARCSSTSASSTRPSRK